MKKNPRPPARAPKSRREPPSSESEASRLARPLREDLVEALEIAERGSMRLHECDAHLEWARLCRQRGDRNGAQGHVARARKLVEDTGYGRRRREVEWLEKTLREDHP